MNAIVTTGASRRKVAIRPMAQLCLPLAESLCAEDRRMVRTAIGVQNL
jgi:hypothetical protein